MTWIEVIDESEADGELKSVYDSIVKSRGKMSNIVRSQSLNARALKAHMDLYASTMYGKISLRRADRELIGVVVSAANQCPYCIHHHADALNAFWKDSDRVSVVLDDYRIADLSEAQMALCTFAHHLTISASTSKEADVIALRDVGYSDEAILNITLITGYFNFVNRIALALGVEYSETELTGYKYED